MIRVSNMTVQPTVDRQQLKVDLAFVASYPKPDDDKSKKGRNNEKDCCPNGTHGR